MLPPPVPSEYGVPVAFDEVVRKAMAKEPAERYPSAAAFAEALRCGLVGSARSVPSDAASGRLMLVAIAVPVVVIAGVGATVLAQGQGRRTRRRRPIS